MRESQKICGIYKITNLVNGKIYIGSSKDIKYRWSQHKTQLRGTMHGNTYLQNAWNKYNEENFKFEIIEECSPEIQFEREQYYLDLLNPFDDNGYNIVRRISRQYMSDNYMIKECEECGKQYHTFSHRSKYCEECKEEIKRYNRENWPIYWVPPGINETDLEMWGYDDWDSFWEGLI